MQGAAQLEQVALQARPQPQGVSPPGRLALQQEQPLKLSHSMPLYCTTDGGHTYCHNHQYNSVRVGTCIVTTISTTALGWAHVLSQPSAQQC
jgi:hypothetical protein